MSKCTCNLIGETGTISGSLRLSQESIDSPTIIEGEIKGLAVGKHGISINVYGDMTGGATTCGPIFNPKGKNHGAPQDEERMAGDLGNVIVNTDESCTVHIEDSNGVKLIGPHSVIGRSVVVYAGEDDCGRGGHELSLTTGNSFSRVAAGVIGMSA